MLKAFVVNEQNMIKVFIENEQNLVKVFIANERNCNFSCIIENNNVISRHETRNIEER